MSASALKSAVTTTTTAPPKDLAHLLAMPSVQSQIKAALPRHMTAERMARIATTEMRKVPKLGQCDPMSFLGAVIQCAQLGLEPGNALGHAYILPFDKREKIGGQWRTVRTEAQVIIGYRGMIDLARRSGQIVSIDARAVYDGDKFDCVLGLDARIDHVPDWQNSNRADASKLRFVYAVAKLKDGGVQFDVMSRSEVEGIRSRSKSADNGPWVTDFAAMAVKTVVRRLFKFLPVSIEMQTAVGLDEMAEHGVTQNNGAIIDGEFVFTEDSPQVEQATSSTDQDTGGGEATKTDAATQPAMTYAQFAERIGKTTDPEIAALVMDEARSLPQDLYDDLTKVYRTKFPQT